MIRVNIHEAKTHLSRYIDALLHGGGAIVLCKRNVPVAEIRPLPQTPSEPRPIGGARGEFAIPASFDEPLPESLLEGFEGRST